MTFDPYQLRHDFPMYEEHDSKFKGLPLVYLDNSATTFKPYPVIDAVNHYYKDITANTRRGDYSLAHEADLALLIRKMAGLTEILSVEQKGEGSQTFLVGTQEFAVPLGSLIDAEAEIAKAEAEIKRLEGFLQGILKKLSNERFVANAPAQVVELERKKQADAESKIAALKESVKALRG